MSARQLPPKIILDIIGHLDFDAKRDATLNALLLTSRSLRDLVLPIRYRKLHIRNKHIFSTLRQNFQARPDLRQYCRELTLTCSPTTQVEYSTAKEARIYGREYVPVTEWIIENWLPYMSCLISLRFSLVPFWDGEDPDNTWDDDYNIWNNNYQLSNPWQSTINKDIIYAPLVIFLSSPGRFKTLTSFTYNGSLCFSEGSGGWCIFPLLKVPTLQRIKLSTTTCREVPLEFIAIAEESAVTELVLDYCAFNVDVLDLILQRTPELRIFKYTQMGSAFLRFRPDLTEFGRVFEHVKWTLEELTITGLDNLCLYDVPQGSYYWIGDLKGFENLKFARISTLLWEIPAGTVDEDWLPKGVNFWMTDMPDLSSDGSD